MFDLVVKTQCQSLFKGNGVLVIVIDIVKSSAFSTLYIFHTPHFPHSTFSTLHVFHPPHLPHSSSSTLLIFYTPHFLHSLFFTLRTQRFPPNHQKWNCARNNYVYRIKFNVKIKDKGNNLATYKAARKKLQSHFCAIKRQ